MTDSLPEGSVTSPDASETGHSLRIGAVARLTGVSVHTLRKWEDRYQAVEPHRTAGGERLYSRADVERLSFIKRLAEAGSSLREISRLSHPELSRAWNEYAQAAGGSARAAPRASVRVALLGNDAISAFNHGPRSGDVAVVATATEATTLERALDGQGADVLVLDCPALRTAEQPQELASRLGIAGIVIVYRFGARRDVEMLRSPHLTAVRAPADRPAVEQAVLGLIEPSREAKAVRAAETETPPTPRLSSAAIRRVSSTAPRVRCECPHHLADILLGLRAFEEYSADCESTSAEDAELHHYLWEQAARARAMFENAIERVANAEGISLDD